MNVLKEAKAGAGGLEQGREAALEEVAAVEGGEGQVVKSALEAAAQAKVAELEQGREAAKVEEESVAVEPAKVAGLEEVAVEGAEAKELAGSAATQAKVAVAEKKASLEASDENGSTTLEQTPPGNEEENKRIIEGSLIAAVATMSAATKIAESKDDKSTVTTTVPTTVTTTVPTTVPTTVTSTVLESKGEEKDTPHSQGLVEQGQGLVAELIESAVPGAVKGATTVKPPVQDTRIKSLFLDNLHLFFGDIHLKPIKEFINPSHQLNQHLDMSTMNGLDRENYEHGRLLTLLKNMFFRESEGVISKERVFKGGGITIDQLKNKIKKGISLIVPKS